MTGIWAVVPVKEFEGTKQRLSSALSPNERRLLAMTMLEDVLDAVSAVPELAGVLVVTVDPAATSLGARYGARIVTEGAREGHTGAVTTAARLLLREGRGGMMTMPRRYTAPLVCRNRRDARGAPGRACVHDRARARRSRVKHDCLFAAERRSAPIRRRQFLPASRCCASPGDRTACGPPSWHRHGYRQSHRPGHVPQNVANHAHEDARLPGANGHRQPPFGDELTG